MIQLRLPVQAHQYGVDPFEEIYRMLGYDVDMVGGSPRVNFASSSPDAPAIELRSDMYETTLSVSFDNLSLTLTRGQYLVQIGPTFTVASPAQFEAFLVTSEW